MTIPPVVRFVSSDRGCVGCVGQHPLVRARRRQRPEDVRQVPPRPCFTKCYGEKRFDDILRVGRRLDRRIVETSTEIFDFIDIAEAKVG